MVVVIITEVDIIMAAVGSEDIMDIIITAAVSCDKVKHQYAFKD